VSLKTLYNRLKEYATVPPPGDEAGGGFQGISGFDALS
jgi:hypothetical protein